MQYIPQAEPFVMIDDIIESTATITRTKFEIRPEHLFVENGFFTEPGLIENMAQTAAAGTGKRALETNTTPPVGFIGAIKNLKIEALPQVGQIIETQVAFLNQVMQVHVVQGEVFCDDKLIAAAEFKIFLQQ